MVTQHGSIRHLKKGATSPPHHAEDLHLKRKLNIELLIWSAFSLFVYFKLRLRGRGFSECIRRRQFENVNALCGLIINKLIPEKEWEVIKSAISFTNHFRLWAQEFLAFAVLYKPLSLGVPGYVVLTLMLDQVEELVERNSMESRQVMRILYEVMSTYEWPPQGEKGINAITRLLRLFYLAASDHRRPCAVLRKGLEVCTFRVLEHMTLSDVRKVMPEVMQGLFNPKLSDSALLDIANVIEHATLFHAQGPYRDIIGDQLFTAVLNMVASKRRVLSLVGNRFLQLMVDRNENRHQFETPKIFFQNTHFNIKIGRFNADDMVFLKRHRELFHNSFLKCVLRHAEHRLSLETVYMSICILACEVPCSFTAAATVCLVINMQEVVRHYPSMKPEVTFHMHATVIAIISLVCWIYDAPDLYLHMNKVMKYRADFAPHLNPPLQNHYIFAQHHITTEKPEFFFEDWEVRYGLWKCFKIKDGRERRESFKEELKKHTAVPKSPAIKKTKTPSKEQLGVSSNEGDMFYVNGN
ncbi:uncharacterized protein [Anabrus simplex]|uniref:uncharacterized protein n=1 Tax=Anabrus simplex TaxID=316456 RepID=UPI0035A28D96